MRVARTDRSLFGQWWFTVDKPLLAAIFLLIGVGVLMSLAASPVIAVKRGLPAYFFVERQLLFGLLGGVIVLGASLLSLRLARRVCLIGLLFSLLLMALVLVGGPEINGARRWIRIAGLSLQPSEFAKPAFAVVAAWLFADAQRRTDMPAIPLCVALYLLFAGLLVSEPDIGQTLLVSAVWIAQYFLAGMAPRVGLGALLGAPLAMGIAYAWFPHVRDRIERFLNPNSGDNFQIERALQAIREGGLFGRGPGEGTIKAVLPDAHTDFVFAVIAEEYGTVVCLLLIALIGFVTLRACARALESNDAFVRLAIMGLVMLFALEALINMAVNTGLVPAKGMTLPFISYGGSSALAVSFTMGVIVTLARHRFGLVRPKKSANDSEMMSGVSGQRANGA